MLTTRELQDEIIRLKKEKDICILAHAYQSHDIWEVADYVGDSYGLSVQAAKAAQSTVLMCGVRFMAETVKILSPQKRVLLSNSNAGCPMAEQMDVELISGVKKMYPDYTVVAYINTTSELKTICDVCVTSSSAVQIVKNIENKNILFIPDCNLGKWVADQVPEKNIKLLQGGCPTHVRMSKRDVEKHERHIRTHFFWYIRNVCRRFPNWRIIGEVQPESWIMQRKVMQRNSLSEPRTVLCSICSLHVRTSSFIHYQETVSATI